jgi:hypothetical protein
MLPIRLVFPVKHLSVIPSKFRTVAKFTNIVVQWYFTCYLYQSCYLGYDTFRGEQATSIVGLTHFPNTIVPNWQTAHCHNTVLFQTQSRCSGAAPKRGSARSGCHQVGHGPVSSGCVSHLLLQPLERNLHIRKGQWPWHRLESDFQILPRGTSNKIMCLCVCVIHRWCGSRRFSHTPCCSFCSCGGLRYQVQPKESNTTSVPTLQRSPRQR